MCPGLNVIWQCIEDPESSGEEDGSDPYGFIMLDGDEGALQTTFKQDFVFVHHDPETKKRKRSLEVDHPEMIEQTFHHVEEEWVVHCAYPPDDERCQNIFKGVHGANETIISLPQNVSLVSGRRYMGKEIVKTDH